MLPQDARRFYEILMPLLDWAKRSKRVRAELKDARANKSRPYDEKNALLNIIWNRPEMIDAYVGQATAISIEARNTLNEWRTNFVPGPFIIERITKEGAIFINTGSGDVYLVNGIIDEIEDEMRKSALPCLVYTSLIPYKGCIVYDSTLQAVPKIIDQKGKGALAKVYEFAKKNHNIIRQLPPENNQTSEEQKNLMKEALMPLLQEVLEGEHKDEFVQYMMEQKGSNLISEKDLSVLEGLLGKAQRNTQEWKKIQEILGGIDLVSAEPVGETHSVKAVDSVLCHEDALLVFTTVEKCSKYLEHLTKKDPTAHSFELVSLPYETALDLAEDNNLKLVIDYADGSLFKKCLVFDPKTRLLAASYVIGH